MKIVHLLRSRNSLLVKLILSVSIMTLPLVGMLLYNNFYSIQVVREQVAQSYNNALIYNMSQIDNDLNDIEAYMYTTASAPSSDLVSLSLAESDDDYYMSKIYLYNKLVNSYSLMRSLNGFFVYVEHRDDFMMVNNNNSETLDDKAVIQQYVTDLIRHEQFPKGTNTKKWINARIGQEYYLIDIVQAGDAYLGAWVQSDQLLSPLQSMNLGEGGRVVMASDYYEPLTSLDFTRLKGIVLHDTKEEYYLSGTEEKYLIVSADSKRGTFQLYALIPEKTILSNLPYLQKVSWLIILVTLIFIPFGFSYMIRTSLVPLGRVLVAMKRVRSGDWNARVEIRKASNEFLLVGNSFNAMMEEIQMLRVNVYEEQIEKQREELQRLQLQINPHFFLNSLNIVYSLAKVKNYDLILEMTMSLILYFRYLFRSSTSFVRLADEIGHIKNYLNIQTLRFPGNLTWEIIAPEYVTEIPVPPLIIQTFVENSIKYAVTMEESIHIEVRIGYLDESGSTVSIQVLDTGKGFPQDILQELQVGRSVENETGEHTGIWNVQRRLRILYHEGGSISFHNDPVTGGAVVGISLPADRTKEETG